MSLEMESLQDVKQLVQSAEQAAQEAKQVAQAIAQDVQSLKQTTAVIGSNQSDLTSRVISKDSFDTGSDERLTVENVDNAAISFMNKKLIVAQEQKVKQDSDDYALALKQVQLKQAEFALQKEKDLHGIFMLKQADNGYYSETRKAQSQAHTEIAVENQWEDAMEAMIPAIVGEVVKSIQSMPNAEYPAG